MVRHMRRVVVGLVVYVLVWMLIPPALTAYDDLVDQWADPSWMGYGTSPAYAGGRCFFYVGCEYPPSWITMIMNSTSRQWVGHARLTTDDNNYNACAGGKSWWLVERVPYGPDRYEKWRLYAEWWVCNLTDPSHSRVMVYSGPVNWSEDGLHCEWANLTLYYRWWGFI